MQAGLRKLKDLLRTETFRPANLANVPSMVWAYLKKTASPKEPPPAPPPPPPQPQPYKPPPETKSAFLWDKPPTKTQAVPAYAPSKKEPAVTYIKSGKWASAGGVVVAGTDPAGLSKVWLRKSKKNPGYPSQWTFPKGKIDKGESELHAAVRETEEEMGVRAKILPGGSLGKFKGDFSDTQFYLMVASGGAGSHDEETEKVGLYPWEKAIAKLAMSGNMRDVKVAKAAVELIRKRFKVDPIRGTKLGD